MLSNRGEVPVSNQLLEADDLQQLKTLFDIKETFVGLFCAGQLITGRERDVSTKAKANQGTFPTNKSQTKHRISERNNLIHLSSLDCWLGPLEDTC